MTRDIHKSVEMLVFNGKDYADQLKIDYKVVYHGEMKVNKSRYINKGGK